MQLKWAFLARDKAKGLKSTYKHWCFVLGHFLDIFKDETEVVKENFGDFCSFINAYKYDLPQNESYVVL